ncbi:MAG: hypothetical protein ACRD9W_19495 [Terriglobia bacterium]
MTNAPPTRAEMLAELGDVLRRKRRARDDAQPDAQEKHNLSINRLQACYEFIMINMPEPPRAY